MNDNKRHKIINRKNQAYTGKVPFVEISPDGNRLQGVVSSGSSKTRVYVCVIDNENKSYTCHTNNNRQCGGLRGKDCSHLRKLLKQGKNVLGKAASQFSLGHTMKADGKKRYPDVFSRYLNLLRYAQLETSSTPIPELMGFPVEVSQ